MIITKNDLSKLLTAAQAAHHKYEEANGKDDNWADWYADFILWRLVEDGYTIRRD